jgi:hypothetical protein
MEKKYFSTQALKSTITIQSQAKEIKVHQFNKCNTDATKVRDFTCKKTQVLNSLFNRLQHEFTLTLLLDSKRVNPYFSTFGDAEIKEGGVATGQTVKNPPYIDCLHTAYPPLFHFGCSTRANSNLNHRYIKTSYVLHSCSTLVEQGVIPK